MTDDWKTRYHKLDDRIELAAEDGNAERVYQLHGRSCDLLWAEIDRLEAVVEAQNGRIGALDGDANELGKLRTVARRILTLQDSFPEAGRAVYGDAFRQLRNALESSGNSGVLPSATGEST